MVYFTNYQNINLYNILAFKWNGCISAQIPIAIRDREGSSGVKFRNAEHLEPNKSHYTQTEI